MRYLFNEKVINVVAVVELRSWAVVRMLSKMMDDAMCCGTISVRIMRSQLDAHSAKTMWISVEKFVRKVQAKHWRYNHFSRQTLFRMHSIDFWILFFWQQQPGKLNLKNFAIVNEAIARMNVNSDNNMQEGDNKKFPIRNQATLFEYAPLAAPEDDSDDLAEYAQVKDVYGLDGVVGSTAPDPTMFNFPQDVLANKSNSKSRHRRDKGQSIVAFPKLYFSF